MECVERGLDPLTTCLVVADESRTEKTICLAATPAIKKYGVPGRARLFEVVQKIKFANGGRRCFSPGEKLLGESCDAEELEKNPNLAMSYIVASPRMTLYMEYSARVYSVYLRYIAQEDIHCYSIDEVFINAEPYLATYKMTAHDRFGITQDMWLNYVGAYKNLRPDSNEPEMEIISLPGRLKIVGTAEITAAYIIELVGKKTKTVDGVRVIDEESMRIILEKIHQLSNWGEKRQAEILTEFLGDIKDG